MRPNVVTETVDDIEPPWSSRNVTEHEPDPVDCTAYVADGPTADVGGVIVAIFAQVFVDVNAPE